MSGDGTSPYFAIGDASRWREAVSAQPAATLDPHLACPLRITANDRIASAGSCFAQRIAGALRDAGYPYLLAEPGPAFLTAEQRRILGYGTYSARYGTVYTALQLVQLFDRAFGDFEPREPWWRHPKGGFVDPFRPAVQPGGFASAEECGWDRKAHLAAVREMFGQLDVFIFTLGLTECWQSADDGAVFPVCPGTALGGEYRPERHRFHNFGVDEVVRHLEEFVLRLGRVNPRARVILTVSPVPLAATFEDRHVLQASVYSKSVLRVACEMLVKRHPAVSYFASYEIVTATGNANYFEADRRTVTLAAVAHVMRAFRARYLVAEPAPALPAAPEGSPGTLQGEGEPMCDEDLLVAAFAEQQAAGKS